MSGFFSLLAHVVPIFGFTLPHLRRSGWTWDLQTNMDPRVEPTPGPIGCSCRDSVTGNLYQKVGPGLLDWKLLSFGGPPDPTTLAYLYDDFFTAQALVGVVGGGLTPSVTLEGDTSSIDLINDNDTDSAGVIRLQSNDSTGGNASAAFSLGNVSLIKFGSPDMPTLSLTWRVRADATPTALSDFFAIHGLTDTPSYPLAQAAGIVFVCGFALFGNGNWWISSKSAPFSPVNCQDTGVPVTNSWANFTGVATSGIEQQWFIDGTQVGVTGTNDLENLEAGIAIQIRTPNGLHPHDLFADFVFCDYPIIRP